MSNPKTTTSICIDYEIHKQAQRIIQQDLNSNVSKEIENYFIELIKIHKKREEKK